jgi:hypothetical protein
MSRIQRHHKKRKCSSSLAEQVGGTSGKSGGRAICREVNQGQSTYSDGPVVESQPKRKPVQLIAPKQTGRGQPVFFQQRKRSANVKGGNSAAVAAGWVDRWRIRDGVNGCDKEQQAEQPDGIFALQSVPESEAAVHLVGLPIKGSNIVHSVQESREIFHDRIGSGFCPAVALPRVDRTSCGWAIARSWQGLPRSPAKRATKAERGGPL